MSHTTTPEEFKLLKRMERKDDSLPNVLVHERSKRQYHYNLEARSEEIEREGSYFPELRK